MKIKLAVESIKSTFGSIAGDVSLGFGLDLSKVAPDELVRLATIDAQRIAALLPAHATEYQEAIVRFRAGDFAAANAILKKIKSTEEAFLEGGGGVLGLAILLFVVVMLYACPAKGDDKKK